MKLIAISKRCESNHRFIQTSTFHWTAHRFLPKNVRFFHLLNLPHCYNMMPIFRELRTAGIIQNICGEPKGIQFDRNDASIKTMFSVFNPNELVFNLLSIPFDMTIHGDKIASGGIGYWNSPVLSYIMLLY
jgi:hypothetical protein